MSDDVELDELTGDTPPEPEAEVRCRYCGESFEGGFAAARRGNHEKRQHREEWEAAKAERDTPISTPRRQRQRSGGSSRSRGSSRSSGPRTDRPPRAPGADREVTDNVRLFYGIIADLWTMRGSPVGPVVRDNIPPIANAWAAEAEHNEAVRRFWTSGIGSGGWLGIALAHAPVGIALYGYEIAPRIAYRRQMAEQAAAQEDFGPEPRTVTYSTNGSEPASEPEPVFSGPIIWPAGPGAEDGPAFG